MFYIVFKFEGEYDMNILDHHERNNQAAGHSSDQGEEIQASLEQIADKKEFDSGKYRGMQL